MKKLFMIFVLALLIANICNCGGGGGSSTSTSGKTIVTINLGETRTASYSDGKLLSASSTIPSNIVNIRFTISAPDMSTIEREVLVAGRTAISESFDVPNGANRYFRVEAMDVSGNRLYWGDTYRDLVGTPLSFEIIMVKDDIPPTFSGISSIDSITSTTMRLSWLPATDDLTPQDKIQYLIFMSATSGGQDFQAPSFTTPQGANSYVATGLTPSTTYYFVVRAKDEAGNSDTNITEMSGTTPQPSPTCDADDLSKAKSLVADIRNTVLSIYNYQGTGVPGIFDTPFKNLSEELTTKIEPELTDTVFRIGWIIDSINEIPSTDDKLKKVPGTYIFTDSGLTLTIIIQAAQNQAGYDSATFTVKDSNGATIDSGSLTLNADASGLITSGTFTATMNTANGKLDANLNYSGTVSGGIQTEMTLTGSITAPYISYDFSESGRKISATFANEPSGPGTGIYPTSIYYSGKITSTTAQMDGTLNISPIVWNTSSNYCNPDLPHYMPKSANYDGSFEELNNGSPTGVKFSGTISGAWDNADTFNICGSDPNDYPKWNASFEGKIEAPSRPAITALLKVAQIAHNKLSLEVDFQRTNTDGTVVSLSGTGEFNGEYDSNGDGVDDGEILTATLSNQCSMKIYITFIPQNPKDNQFTGTITNSGGTKMADLYTINGVPMVKYIDNYIESIF